MRAREFRRKYVYEVVNVATCPYFCGQVRICVAPNGQLYFQFGETSGADVPSWITLTMDHVRAQYAIARIAERPLCPCAMYMTDDKPGLGWLRTSRLNWKHRFGYGHPAEPPEPFITRAAARVSTQLSRLLQATFPYMVDVQIVASRVLDGCPELIQTSRNCYILRVSFGASHAFVVRTGRGGGSGVALTRADDGTHWVVYDTKYQGLRLRRAVIKDRETIKWYNT